MRNKVSIAIVLTGTLFMALGVFITGEATTVFQKATKICLECIGIG